MVQAESNMKILKFYADWCAPCKVISKVLETAKLPVSIIEVDVEENPDMVKDFGIRSVPVIILLTDNGNEMRRWVGVFDINELKQAIEQ